MADVRIVPITATSIMTFDWLQTPTGLLDETQQLVSAITVALNTDAVASAGDALPDPRSTDRRGWWGDMDAESIWGGWPIGSKLWLMTRAKIVDSGAKEGATTVRIRRYIEQALQPFVDKRICTSFKVDVVQHGASNIAAQITIYRGPSPAIQLNYGPLWTEITGV